LSQRAHRAPRRIGNFDAGVHVHVRCSEMPDCEGVAAEINSLETVIHRQLCAEGIVDTRAKKVGFGFDKLAHSKAWMNVTCGVNFEAAREEGGFTQLCTNHSHLSNISAISATKRHKSCLGVRPLGWRVQAVLVGEYRCKQWNCRAL